MNLSLHNREARIGVDTGPSTSRGRSGGWRTVRRLVDASGSQHEVGVESSAEVLEIAAVHLTTQKKYPQSYRHGPGGTFRLSPPLSVMR